MEVSKDIELQLWVEVVMVMVTKMEMEIALVMGLGMSKVMGVGHPSKTTFGGMQGQHGQAGRARHGK